MKVSIWVHKNNVIKNKITKYYLWRPQMSGHDDYVQISITADEFARLEDKKDSNYTYPEFKEKYYGKKKKTKQQKS